MKRKNDEIKPLVAYINDSLPDIMILYVKIFLSSIFCSSLMVIGFWIAVLSIEDKTNVGKLIIQGQVDYRVYLSLFVVLLIVSSCLIGAFTFGQSVLSMLFNGEKRRKKERLLERIQAQAMFFEALNGSNPEQIQSLENVYQEMRLNDGK